MKHHSIFLFLSIALTVYAGLNFYYIKRSAQALYGIGLQRTVIIAVLIGLALAFPLGRVAEVYFRNFLTHFLIVAGSLYLGFFFYALLSVVLVDIIRLGQMLFHFLPAGLLENPFKFLHTLWFSLAGCIIAALGVGFWFDTHPRIASYDLTIPKKSSTMNELTIAAVSDIHFGRVLGERHLLKIKALVKQINPDMVLLLGDLFDEKVPDEQRVQMTGFLKDLPSKYGTYAIVGNHDYFSVLQKVIKVLDEAKVTLLQDSAVTINHAFLLVGRKDLTALRIGDSRKNLYEILDSCDKNLPRILMDHQPFHLEEAQQSDIDVQLSGHTHHGQLFPMNLFYRWIYETSWGYLRKGNTQVIVSCGAGTWGPPVRTNSRSEVLKIKLKFL
jgi:uncharacterized protein